MSPCSSDCIFRASSALSGVQSLRILEGYELLPPHLSELPASVHGERQIQELPEPAKRALATESHLSDDAGEPFEVRLLRREQRGTLEERDHTLEQRRPITHHE